MDLNEWARYWGIPLGAVIDLRLRMGVDATITAMPSEFVSESSVSQRERVKIQAAGGVLWRNNVGAYQDSKGRWVRYGLANDSKRMNKVTKSSDLIGILPVVIKPEMVGSTIGQFVAIETKKSNWVYTGTEREVAQRNYLNIVISKGGRGHFSNGQ